MVLFKGTRSFSGGCSSSIFFPGTFAGRFLVGWNFWTPLERKVDGQITLGQLVAGELLLVFWLSLRKGEVTCRIGFSHEGLSFCFPDFFPPGFACFEIERFSDGKDLKNTTYPTTFCFE